MQVTKEQAYQMVYNWCDSSLWKEKIAAIDALFEQEEAIRALEIANDPMQSYPDVQVYTV